MIVLDTDVVSEAMRREPDPAVREWLNAQVAETLYLSSLTLAEILFGIAALLTGRRRTPLLAPSMACSNCSKVGFCPLMLMRRDYADLAVAARSAGRGFPVLDGTIAAVAAARGCLVAARDTAPYEAAAKSPD